MCEPFRFLNKLDVRVIRKEYIKIETRPQAKQSTKFNGKQRRAYTSPSKRKYILEIEKEIKRQFEGKQKIKGLVRITVLYVFPWRQKEDKRLQKHVEWNFHEIRPDIDNLSKLILDAMKDVCYSDDCVVVGLSAYKIRSNKPGYWVLIEEIEPAFQELVEKYHD